MSLASRDVWLLWQCVAAVWILGACADTRGPAENSQTHWLRQCTGDPDCGDLRCVCGVCNQPCADDATCGASVGEGTVCGSAGDVSGVDRCATPAVAERRVCVAECRSDGECEARAPGLACVAHLCSLAASVDDAGSKDASVGDGAVASMDAAAGDSGVEAVDSGTTDAGDAGAQPPGSVLACDDGGLPLALPAGWTLIAEDANGWDFGVSNGIATWLHQPTTMETATLGRAALDGSDPSFVDLQPGASYLGLAVDGGDAFLRYSRYVDAPVITYVQSVAQNGAVLNLAEEEAGAANEDITIDADAVYWMQRAEGASQASLVRAPRSPGATASLGTLQLTGTAQNAVGPIVIGAMAYVARNDGAAGQVMRARTDGSLPLEPLGSALPAVTAMLADGTDLLLMLQPERDALDNPVRSARVVRMSPAGELVTLVEVEGEPATLARVGDRLYWTIIDNTDASSYHGTLWSAPVDGSRLPTSIAEADEAVFGPRLRSDEQALYLALTCLQRAGSDIVTQINHLVRFAP